jgi:citrate lyase subunit beta / citryl-CoA lyase
MQSRPYRALLFVPGSRSELVPKALATGADALVLDLEDAVAENAKAEAREHVAEAIGICGERGVFVRINDLSTDHWEADLRAIVRAGLTGVSVPKVETTDDLRRVAARVGELEREARLEPGSIDLQPLLETASAIHGAFDLLSASPRIRSYFGGFARDGDVARTLGARWTRGGHESLYLRSKLLLDGRAAGVPFPISGTWADLADVEGLAAFARQNRDLGYTGMYVIHPSHVEAVTSAFTPSGEELAWYRRVVETLDEAGEAGTGAVAIDGVMIDKAMAVRARAILSANVGET